MSLYGCSCGGSSVGVGGGREGGRPFKSHPLVLLFYLSARRHGSASHLKGIWNLFFHVAFIGELEACVVCKKKKGFERKRLYITSMSECWRHDSGRMPCGTWQECGLWLNIPVSLPTIGKLLAARASGLTVDLLTRWTRLFESSIPPSGFYGRLSTHARPPPALPPGLTLVRALASQQQQQLLSLWIQSTGFLCSDWSLLISWWINGERHPLPPPNCLPDHRGGFISGGAQKSEVFVFFPKQWHRLSLVFSQMFHSHYETPPVFLRSWKWVTPVTAGGFAMLECVSIEMLGHRWQWCPNYILISRKCRRHLPLLLGSFLVMKI